MKIPLSLPYIKGLLTLQGYMHSINAQFIYETRELMRVKMFVYILCAPPVSPLSMSFKPQLKTRGTAQ